MNRKKLLLLAAALAGMASVEAAEPSFRQTYPLDPGKVRDNAAKIAKVEATLPAAWKNTPAFYFTVPALSDVPRLPDSYPSDGQAAGTLRLLLTRGEFEPASFVVYPRRNVDRFMLKAGPLKSEAGDVIPASDVDVKLVKTWYQSGAGWYGYFADALGRTLVPELLLNDENMVRADSKTKDNYVRYNNVDGSVSYQWMTAHFSVTNYSFDNQANIGLIADAPELQPVVLNKDEFKQFFVTVKAPKNAKGGLYRGGVTLEADGKVIGEVPVSVRVLPFELPAAKTNYDRNKGFYLCLYGTGSHNPAILKNIADHNALCMGFPSINVFEPESFREDIKLAKENGVLTRPIFSGSEGVGLGTSAEPKGVEVQKLARLKRIIQETAALCKKELGHTDFYSYGIDEGGPWAIRSERNAWRIAHDAGGKVMVTSFAWRELLYALDYLIIPGAPAARRIKEVNLFHESNPDALTGWYANPHSGPENPNYFRRLHGYQSWKSNYDVSSNYCWWRNNWNDMATPYEESLRGLIMVYAGRDRIFDTIAWEGVREGMDDVKYASYLKDLALEAARSQDGTVKLLGRRVLSFLAYTDEERVDLDAFRLECVNYMIQLRSVLKKGNN